MYFKLLSLEIKNFLRSKEFATGLAMKIFMLFIYIFVGIFFVGGAFLLYHYAENKLHTDPLKFFSKFFVYYWVYDLVVRYFFQQMPTQNIKPFLSMNITKKTLVNYTILKTFTSFFNWGNLLFFIPFAVLLIQSGHSGLGVLLWLVAMMCIFYFNNFLNILLNGKDWVPYLVAAVFMAFGFLDYKGYFKLTDVSETVFYSFYSHSFTVLIPLFLMMVFAWLAYTTIKRNFYLDQALETKKTVGKTQNIKFLNQFGVIGTFINNDIRLLLRSKAAQSTLISSVLFLFYGLLMFTTPTYRTPYMMMFLGIFVTGGFMFMFAQRVPSWDSSYYPLMMTLNVPYKEYLESKWWLMNMVTFASMMLASFYLFFSWEAYLTFIAAGLYNIGVNSHLTLLGGAFNKSAIDLNSKSKSMGDKNAFNLKSILLIMPKLLLPMLVFGIFQYFFGIAAGVASIAVVGILGFLLRDFVFSFIVKRYKKEKYAALQAFKEGN